MKHEIFAAFAPDRWLGSMNGRCSGGAIRSMWRF